MDSNVFAELDEQVYLWSHVEAYASVITACLPTLSPLFLNMRSLDSIVGSVRSALSIRSKGSSLFRHTPSETHSQKSRTSDIEKASWNRSHSDGIRSTVERGTNNRDLEAQTSNHEAIMVQKTFASDSARAVRWGNWTWLWSLEVLDIHLGPLLNLWMIQDYSKVE